MSDKEDAHKYRLTQAQKIIDLFIGACGHPPQTMEELESWAASPEGKAALAYDRTPGGKIIPE
jgi:hypothetical protein